MVKKLGVAEKLKNLDGRRPTKEQLIVSVAERFIENLEKKGSGIGYFQGYLRIYTDKHWQLVSKRKLESMICAFALKSGVLEVKAKHFKYRIEYWKQVEASCKTVEKNCSESTLINLKNGTLEINSDSLNLREHRKDDYLTYILPYDYDRNAKCPKFDSFIDQILPEKEKQNVLSEFFGSALDLNINHEKVLLNYGGGANGKSVLINIISAALGSQNVCNYPLSDLASTQSRSRFHLANHLINFSSEISGSLHNSAFKKLASGEPIDARELYGNTYNIYRYARLAFNCNALPFNKEQTEGFFRRWLIVPFTVYIPAKMQDKTLAAKIMSNELTGVLNWIIEGLQRLKSNGGFSECLSCTEELRTYRAESDCVARFMEANYLSTSEYTIPMKDIHSEYSKFCEDSSIVPVKYNGFWKRIEVLGFDRARRNRGNVIFCKPIEIFNEIEIGAQADSSEDHYELTGYDSGYSASGGSDGDDLLEPYYKVGRSPKEERNLPTKARLS